MTKTKKAKRMKKHTAFKAAGAGAAVGGAGAVSTVAASGTVAGLGATGITSGLAAVGSIIGGGMATGLAITAAIPVVTGVAAYFGYKWLMGDEDDE